MIDVFFFYFFDLTVVGSIDLVQIMYLFLFIHSKGIYLDFNHDIFMIL